MSALTTYLNTLAAQSNPPAGYDLAQGLALSLLQEATATDLAFVELDGTSSLGVTYWGMLLRQPGSRVPWRREELGV